MPELKDLPKGKEWSLQNAHEHNQVVKLACYYCRISRLYYAGDLLQICGDIPLRQIPSKFRCEKCRSTEYMHADFQNVYGSDYGKLKVRKLISVKMSKRFIWRDEPLAPSP